jgi:recombination protein RecA
LIGKIQDGNKNVVGVNVKAVVVKNRLGPPHRTAEFDIYFDRGIDDYGSWLTVLKDNNLVKQSGAWYTIVDETTGEEVKFQSKDFPKFLEENITRREAIYEKICDVLIMKYKSEYNPDATFLNTGDDDSKELLLD